MPEDESYVIFTYGDSQGEVLDYVFHGCPQYRKYEDDCRVGWRSGWSTRGLGHAEHVERLTEPLKELAGTDCKHAFVFLAFGSADIEWNLSYKRDVLKQEVDTAAFLEQMVAALEASVDRILAAGEAMRAPGAPGGPEVHVVLCFPFVPLPLKDGYLEEYNRKHGGGSYRVIARPERLALWRAFTAEAERRVVGAHAGVRVVNVAEDFERDGLEAYIHLDEEDHHPNFAKSQHAVAARVRALRFGGGGARPGANTGASPLRLEPREWPHPQMYPRVRRRFPEKNEKTPTEPTPTDAAAAPPAAAAAPAAASAASNAAAPRRSGKEAADGESPVKTRSPASRSPLGTLRPALTQSPVMARHAAA